MISNSKRGSYIAEASIVLPMVVLAVITVMLIVMFFYSQVTEQSRLHIALRSEAGKASGKTLCIHAGTGSEISDAEIYVDEGIAENKAYGKKYLIMKNRGLLNERKTFTVDGSWTYVDGVSYIRYTDIVRSSGNEK